MPNFLIPAFNKHRPKSTDESPGFWRTLLDKLGANEVDRITKQVNESPLPMYESFRHDSLDPGSMALGSLWLEKNPWYLNRRKKDISLNPQLVKK